VPYNSFSSCILSALACFNMCTSPPAQIRMDLKHLKTKKQKAASKHTSETESLQVCG